MFLSLFNLSYFRVKLEIGKLVICLSLIDLGFVDDGHDRVDSFRPIQQQEKEVSVLESMEVDERPAVAPSNPDVEKVTLELEEWKAKQKDLFKQQVFRHKLQLFILV